MCCQSSPCEAFKYFNKLHCDTQSEAALEALVSSMIESFFGDLEAESSSGVYEMHDLFIASDVAVAKISPTGLHKK